MVIVSARSLIACAIAVVVLHTKAQVLIPSGNGPFGPPGVVFSNANPVEVLKVLVDQLQHGSEDPRVIGMNLWEVIRGMSNNTGVIFPLVPLGKVTTVNVVGRRDLPAGPVYSLVATHESGQSSTWILGISTQTNKVEIAQFQVNTSTAQPLPPQPGPTTPQSSEACKKFPNLCPEAK